jgi:hypothetical protein
MKEESLVYTLDFGQITLKHLARVGGKNASLGELFNSLKPKGIGILDGFATTADEGLVALLILILAEVLVALFINPDRPRDTVSGIVYLMMLGVFALMPWFLCRRQR